MNGSGKPFFDQFLNEYFSETDEHLVSARQSMLAIESAGAGKPVDPRVLDELLRNFHSIKGLSAMVGLEDAAQLSHHIEDYLKELKRPRTVISSEGMDSVVAGITAIEQVVEAKRKSEPPPDISTILLQLDVAAQSMEIAQAPTAKAPVNRGSWRFVFRPSPELAQQGLNVNSVRERLRGIGEILRASPQVLADGQLAFEFTVASNVPETAFENLRPLGIEWFPVDNDRTASPAPKDAPTEPSGSQAGSSSVVRVEMERLDDLMRIVGELVISRSRLGEIVRTMPAHAARTNAFQEINSSMEHQLRQLREAVVRIRMVPIGQVFEKMRFVVRGLERELSKRIEVRIEGHSTELDKLVVERMMDPLLHLVRNAVSHGLESPAERISAGKAEIGSLLLSARASGDTVTIAVEDDGRGLDAAQVMTRARQLGLIRGDEALDTNRLLDIISAPGFTTRDQADLSSGRGVGMAAVRSAIGELGGSVTLTTARGKGTRFAIRLPLTLLISDSLMVSVGEQRFAIPQTSVSEVFAIEPSAIKVLENNEVVPYRGTVLPLLRLTRFFGFAEGKSNRLHLLVIANGNSPMAIAVDRIRGQREIVVRTITDPLLRVPGVVGATELGDGRPVLILDPHSLIRSARHSSSNEVRA